MWCHPSPQKLFYTSSFLISFEFPIVKKPIQMFKCIESVVYSLFTLQLPENSIPWFVFVLTWCAVNCCRKVSLAPFHINLSNLHTLVWRTTSVPGVEVIGTSSVSDYFVLLWRHENVVSVSQNFLTSTFPPCSLGFLSIHTFSMFSMYCFLVGSQKY